MQANELPDDVAPLLQVLTRDAEAESRALAQYGRSIETLRAATEFYVANILFAPQAGHYRVLAARPKATREQLRSNMGLLLRWLHPDTRSDREYEGFFNRVTAAWDVLGSPQKRAEYDLTLQKTAAPASPARQSPMVRQPTGHAPFFRTDRHDRYESMRRARQMQRRRLWRWTRRIALVALLVAASWISWTHPLWFDQLLDMDWYYGESQLPDQSPVKTADISNNAWSRT